MIGGGFAVLPNLLPSRNSLANEALARSDQSGSGDAGGNLSKASIDFGQVFHLPRVGHCFSKDLD